MSLFENRDGKLYHSIWGMNTLIEAWGPDILRVRTVKSGPILDDLPSVLLPPRNAPTLVEIHKDYATITNGRLRAQISKHGWVSFGDIIRNTVLLQASQPPRFSIPDGDLCKIEACFKPAPEEKFYGLGQHRHGKLDQRGCVIDLYHHNSLISIPFYVSSLNYGFFWNNPGLGRVELAENGTRWVADGSRQLDYFVIAGDNYASIMENYCHLTGFAPAFPRFASGFWQCKLRYASQDELLDVAWEYKRRDLPLSVIVIDYFHWTKMGEWKFDPKDWPDPEGMVKKLKEMGVEPMVSIWPTVNTDCENYVEMEEAGMLLKAEAGIKVFHRFVDTGSNHSVYMNDYDPSNPEARKFIWNKVKQGYYDKGLKAFWLDACEPEVHDDQLENMRFSIGNGKEYAGLYPWYHEKAFFDGLSHEGEKEIITLCRSAWAGSQRFGAAVWSGDIRADFAELTAQVRAGLNMAMSGIPWWTTDIGGFEGGNPNDPAYQEVFVRWFQWGTFCPIMRVHGHRDPRLDGKTGGPNELWSYGEKAFEILKKFVMIREKLRPYIMDQMDLASKKGLPMMRPLFVDFPNDSKCFVIEDEFLFGPDILVAPVTTAGQTARGIYLPLDAEWMDAWTGEVFSGGTWRTFEAPIDRIPIFLRKGGRQELETVFR